MPADHPRLPYFIPADLEFKRLPGSFRKAVDDIILPAYQELVLEAPTSLERSAGTTLCCDMWFELLEQFHLRRALGETLPKRLPVGTVTSSPEPYGGPFLPHTLSLERYLRLSAERENRQVSPSVSGGAGAVGGIH